MTNQGSEPGDTTVDKRRRSAFRGIEQRVLKRLRALNLGERPRIVVGFSGGADSLCLAAILARLARSRLVDPVLVHINHGLRPEADRDAEAAAAISAQLGLQILISAIPAGLRELHPGAGIEEAARRERYRMLANAASGFEARTIAVAHHESDQAETVLLHLLRGAGLKGVSGMAEVTTIEIPWWGTDLPFATDFDLWRPLLREPKLEIDAFVATSGLTPLVDQSNLDPDFRRNAVRHSVLPVIEAVFPAAKSSLARFAEIAREDDDLLTRLSLEALEGATGDGGHLSRSRLLSERTPIQRRMLVAWLGKSTTNEAISLDRIDAVLHLAIEGRHGKVIEAAGHIRVELNGDDLVVRISADDQGIEMGKADVEVPSD